MIGKNQSEAFSSYYFINSCCYAFNFWYRGSQEGIWRKKTENLSYIYKVNKSGEVYVGRTSGYDTPAKNIQRRDARHHMNKQGFKRANLDKSSPNKNAIRGREQQLIEKYRDEGKSANKINGISDKNPKKKRYIGSSTKKFGKP